jgi:tetratricopeptide (TPR) repeat protein
VYHDSDVNIIYKMPPFFSPIIAKEDVEARRILQHYESVFPAGSIEHDLLRCIGLFDRPMPPEALDALRRAPVIEGLTASLLDLPAAEYTTALRNLSRLRLVDYARPFGPLESHPIIRAHFGEVLSLNVPAWREANLRLSRYYAAMPQEEYPTSRENMDPLYAAVVHACKANACAEAWHIYWDRIQQGHPRYFNTNVLGAFLEGLGSLASFYAPPWDAVAKGVEEALGHQNYLKLLTEVGFHLKVLGRFGEAKKMIRSAMEAYDKDADYAQAAVNSENLAEAEWLSGNLRDALLVLQSGRGGVPYSEISHDPFRRMQTIALRGQILLGMGRFGDAEAAFAEAEQIRSEHCPTRQPVRSLYILDLLAEIGRYEELFAIIDRFQPLLDEDNAKPFTGMFYMFVGQAHALLAIREENRSAAGEALRLLDDATRLIDASNLPHLQPWAPCIRARLLIHLGENERAKWDLDKALGIAQHAQLRLFVVNCHLGLCDLNLKLGKLPLARAHLEAARPQIANGYARPQRWMEAMDAAIQGLHMASGE